MVLAFFSSSDGIVNANIATNFVDEIKILEGKMFYHFQETIEDVHNEAYSLLIDTYIKDQEEKSKLFNAMDNINCVKLKANWALKYLNKDCSFAERILAFAAVEGIFFSGSFCAIYWLKKRGLMPGLTFSNELISRDEGLHTDFACLVYSYLNDKLEEKDAHAIFADAVNIETQFITESLPCSLVGMNNKLMSQYIQFVCDRILQQLGYNKLFNVSQPFDFMDLISMRNKVNFFEKRVQDYKKPTTQKKFNLQAAF
jgi:ribonucleotide reductase beta subunit family protein with ferritin-like domain